MQIRGSVTQTVDIKCNVLCSLAQYKHTLHTAKYMGHIIFVGLDFGDKNNFYRLQLSQCRLFVLLMYHISILWVFLGSNIHEISSHKN